MRSLQSHRSFAAVFAAALLSVLVLIPAAAAEDKPVAAGALLDAVQKNSKTMVEFVLTQPSITQKEKDEALFAAINGNVKAEIMEALINGGADVNGRDEHQDTPLILAIGKVAPAGNSAGGLALSFHPLGPVRTRTINALLAKGADPTLSNAAGDIPLTLLAAKSEPALLEAMLQKVKSRDIADGAGRTALMIAARESNAAGVDKLLTHQGQIDAADAQGKTALTYAAEGGSVDIARALIKAGANPNHKDKQGNTPLVAASKSNHPPMVKLLIASGANANLGSSEGKQALSAAKNGATSEIVENLKPALTRAIEKNDLPEFEKLVAAKSPINVLNPDGGTPLTTALELTRSNMASILLENGANANARSGNGTPAIIIAAQHGDYPLVRLLLNKGAHPNDLDKAGKSAQYYAAQKGYGSIEELLKQAGK